MQNFSSLFFVWLQNKKKWSFRSISFSRKDKSKPVREATPKNGDVAKEEPLAEVRRALRTDWFPVVSTFSLFLLCRTAYLEATQIDRGFQSQAWPEIRSAHTGRAYDNPIHQPDDESSRAALLW